MQSEDVRFSWQRMGKPDYAVCAGLVYSLPSEIRSKLSAPALEILCRITFLCWSFSTRSGRGRAYCIPSERWLAKQVGRSERSIRRYLGVLRAYGLLSWIRRKGTANQWLSNLYELGKTFLASIYARGLKKVQQIHQRTFLADNDLKKGIEGVSPTTAPSNSTSLPKDTPAPPSEASPLREASDAVPRKTMRERIAEMIAAGKIKPQREKPVEVVPETDRRAMLLEQARRLKERGL